MTGMELKRKSGVVGDLCGGGLELTCRRHIELHCILGCILQASQRAQDARYSAKATLRQHGRLSVPVNSWWLLVVSSDSQG